MADITINPFGTGGELPTNIGIVNDLDTGGADKALSAEQGKILGRKAVAGLYLDSDDAATENVYLDTDDFGNIAVGSHIWGSDFETRTWQNNNRATEADVIDNDLPATFDIYVPSGYKVGVRWYQADGGPSGGTGAYSDWYSTAGWQTITNKDKTTWKYIALNFGLSGDANFSDATLATLNSEFKIRYAVAVEPAVAGETALSLVNANGTEVAGFISPVAEAGEATEVYTKDAVDTLLGADIPSSRIIRVATWNIGHLSYGASSSGGYSGDTAVSKQKAWRKAVNGFAANILCCQEYEPNFGTLNSESVTTADAVMGGIYGDNSIGGKNNYQCQAIFSKSALANGQDVYYDLSGNAGGTYRYQKAETTINGKTVTIISCHFPILSGDWSSSVQRACMNEVIAACANLDYAIVCMDSNFETTDRFDNFISAGFKLANHGDFGDIKTWPTDGVKANYASLADWWPTKALDCIAVKGFKVSNVQIYSDSELTDHCAIIADLTMV